MNLLAVLCHPNRDSFCGALLDALVDGAQDAGHDVRVADLYGEGFQPSFVSEDFAQFDGKAMPEDVRREQARVEWSEGLVFVFPIWWWSTPAMFKGWIDRVFSYGWAWADPTKPEDSLLGARRALVLATAGASQAQFAKRRYDEALHTQLDVGTWGYCGFRDVTTRIFHEVDRAQPGTDYRAYLAEARELGRTFQPRSTMALAEGQG